MPTPSPSGRLGPAQVEGWPLAVLDRVLAPAGVRLLAVDGSHRDPLGATAGEDRPTSAEGSEDAGIPVVGEAGGGAQGVELAEELRPDVVLMDWRMPQLDGLQATARIRRQLPEMQVVMFSSAEGVGGGILARQAGASAFVAKCSPPEQLCAAVLAAWQSPGGPS